MNNKKLLLLIFPTKSFGISRFIRGLAAFTLSSLTAVASAGPMSYTFDTATNAGSATGSFSGIDVSSNNVLVKEELQSFSIHATGTLETGPISFSAIESISTFFFNRELFTLDFLVTNGLEFGSAGFRALECSAGCLAISGTFRIYSDAANFPGLVQGIRFAPVAAVSAPTTFTLFGLGLAGLGWSRRRSKKYDDGIQPSIGARPWPSPARFSS